MEAIELELIKPRTTMNGYLVTVCEWCHGSIDAKVIPYGHPWNGIPTGHKEGCPAAQEKK